MFSSLLSPSQNLFNSEVANATMQTEIAAVIPVSVPCSELDCGPSPLGGGLNPTCTVCDGRGTITTEMTSILKARVFWLNDAYVAKPQAQSSFLTGPLAEVALSFPLSEERDVRVLLTSGQIYFIVDGARIRPTTSMRNSMYGESSFVVFGNLESQERV